VDTLLGFYYQQKDFHQKNKRWAELKELSVTEPGLKLKKTATGFRATLHGKSIREDGLIQ
jgi:hypothetical protein